jgi:hypothetical protein
VVSALSEDVTKELATAQLLHALGEQIPPPQGAWEELGSSIASGAGSEQVALLLAPNDGALHLRLAGARLDDLLFALSRSDFARVPSLADSLEAERAAALDGGANVQLLDSKMTSALTPALAGAPATVAHTVRDCLNDAVPDDDHDAPGDTGNPDAASDGSSVISGQSAPSPAPSRQPAPQPSYPGTSPGTSEEGD